MRSHTGAILTFGKERVFSLSNKQKVNSTSSTVAKIIGVDYAMNFVMRVKLFIEQQVENLPMDQIIKKLGKKPSVLQQGNTTSSIQLKVNGKKSSTKQTQHINIRYFYVINKVKSGSVVVVYHPTKEMVSDYLTKPLNGTPFKSHRNMIMGLTKESNMYYKEQYENAKNAYWKCIGV